MMRPHRLLPRSILSISLATSLVAPVLLPATRAFAQDAAVASATDAAPAKELLDAVETYWHYGKIARYDLANEAGTKLIDTYGSDPVALLRGFEAVSSRREDNLDQWLLRWQGVPATRENTTKIIQTLTAGYNARRSDPTFIDTTLTRMSVNERAYVAGLDRLRQSGELVAPIVLDGLKNPAKREQFATYRRVLRDLGRPMLNPLVIATQMKDDQVLITVIDALGDLGYDIAVPYLSKLQQASTTSPAVKTAAASALGRLGAGDVSSLKTAELFYELAEKFYYDKASISADPRAETSEVWYWAEDKGLTRREVPRPIFNEVLALRAAAESLALDPARADTVALWLAANTKREVELPAGATDATHEAGAPDSHYYNLSAGTTLINLALERALNDKSSGVALKLVESLQPIVGKSNLFGGDGSGAGPLVKALSYPDRAVRVNAAFALAASSPDKPFNGVERVVPLLGEAVAQTGKPSVLVVFPDTVLNGLVKELTDAGYVVAGASNAEAAVIESAKLPSVDTILVSEDLAGGTTEIEKLFTLANNTPRMALTARVVSVKTKASPWADKEVTDKLINTTQAVSGADLKPAIDAARTRSGVLPLDEAGATAYALKSADLLTQLATRQSGAGAVYDLGVVEPALLASLDDTRPEVVKAVGNVLALLGTKRSQEGLATKATADGVADDVKISLFKDLAISGKRLGNQLEPNQVDALIKSVASATDVNVRTAAAEARGALDLPTDQVKDLILGTLK